MRPSLLALLFAASSTAAAQAPVSIPDAPQRAGEIPIAHANDTPEGAYTIRDEHASPSPHTISFVISGCASLRRGQIPERLRGVPAQTFVRCDVHEIVGLGSGGTGWDNRWESIVFSRYVSPLVGEDGLSISEWWAAELVLGHRLVRLFIGQGAFVMQDGSATSPILRIIEAPIVRQ